MPIAIWLVFGASQIHCTRTMHYHELVRCRRGAPQAGTDAPGHRVFPLSALLHCSFIAGVLDCKAFVTSPERPIHDGSNGWSAHRCADTRAHALLGRVAAAARRA